MRFRGLRIVPLNTRFDFVGYRFFAFALTALLLLATLIALPTRGLNLGIDFIGGLSIEIAAPDAIDVGELRARLGGLAVGEINIQQSGAPDTVLIRVQAQADEAADRAAVQRIRDTLGSGYDYRRIERVGPKVGGELLRDGLIATVLAILGIGVYVYVRFEWQFAVAAL